MVAAAANGVVPGKKFATVSPSPPSTNVRRETLNLVMTFSLSVFFGSVQERALRRTSRRRQLRRATILSADKADGEKIAVRRCLWRARRRQIFIILFARGVTHRLSRASALDAAPFSAIARQDQVQL